MVRVFYHKNCPDGMTAAWVFWEQYGDQATYHPVSYGDPLVPVEPGDHVYIVDFSFPRAVLETARQRAALIRVLDHHKTAQENLAGLDYVTFDMNKSGATLAWDYLHPNQPRPRIVEYAEDRDLWRFALPGSRAVSQWLRCFPYTFKEWEYAARGLEQDLTDVISQGSILLTFQNQQVVNMCDQARIMDVGGYVVPVVNASVFFSEVGEELLKRYPDAPFAAYYFDRADGKRQWGLRSRPDFDCSVVAKAQGGGGHPQAAGFTGAC